MQRMCNLNRSNKEGIRQNKKIYQELGSLSFRDRRWCRKHCLFCKVLENESPKYLFILIPARRSLYLTRNIRSIPLLMKKHSFFPSAIIEWNNLDLRFGKSVRFLKSTFVSSYNHLQTLFIIFITMEEFVYLQDLA